MSKIKELKSMPENNVNLAELFSLLCPEGKTKYVETLLRIMRGTESLDEVKTESIESLQTDYGISKKISGGYDVIHLIYLKKFLEDMFDLDDIQKFQKFCKFNERGLIENNDLSKYRTFKEVENATNLAELRECEKEMESQIIRFYEDSDWLMLRPLTHQASKKYGSATKWCTTSENDSEYFDRYNKGILIYVLNKRSGLKIAAFKSLTESEFSFWNAADEKIDSLDSGLPLEILSKVKEEIKLNKVSNVSYLDSKGKSTRKSLPATPVQKAVPVQADDEDEDESSDREELSL